MQKREETSLPSNGFGYSDRGDLHHFIVSIPADAQKPVLITEQYGRQSDPRSVRVDRCLLARPLWAGLAEEIRCEFNERLRADHLPSSWWHVGENRVECVLGKELLALAWAVEGAECSALPAALRNWQGLDPAERWWLCTMTAAATGSLKDVGMGWRRALYYALVEGELR